MVQINFALKEVNCKIVYYGPGMSGKTTNLEIVHQKAPDQHRGELTSISTDGDRTLFFDFMPLDLGNIAGMRTKFQLYTVPGQVYYNSTRKLVLQGVDGVIFVADSDRDKMAENIESYDNLIENLTEYGKDVRELPHVIQYNKRDHPNAMPVEEMDRAMNKFGVPTFEAVAITGEGVFPTLKVLAGMVLESIEKMDNRRPGKQGGASAAAALREVGEAPAQRKAAAPAAKGAPAAPARHARPAAAQPAAPAAPAGAPSRSGAQRKPGAAGGRPSRASAPRVPAPAPAAAKGSGRMFLTTFALVLVAAAVAGVVYFVMQNPG